jgi:hypothetical protein
MADADRIAAALNYQQKLDDALAPVTANTRLMRQGENSRSQLAAALANQPPAEPSWTQKALPMEGRDTFLPYHHTLPGSVMDQRTYAVPGAIAGMANAISAPSRAYQGGYDVDENGNITPKFNAPEEAANVAMNVMGGGFGASRAAGGAPSGALGMFIGKSAKNWDAAAEARALQMEANKIDPKLIRSETGVSKGPEGKLRQEIPDNNATFSGAGYPIPTERDKLINVLKHDILFENYPQLKNINIEREFSENTRGSWNPEEKIITAGGGTNQTESQAKSTILHELQHAIQDIEGFAKGANPEIMGGVLRQQEREEIKPYLSKNAEWNRNLQMLGQASRSLYLHKLKDLSVADNIKPRSIFSLNDWYKYGNEIRGELGKMPTRPGFQRDEWLRRAAQSINKSVLKENPYWDQLLNTPKEESLRVYNKANRNLSKNQESARAYNEVVGKFKKFYDMPKEEQYRHVAGEAEARLTQDRMNLTAEERKAIHPEYDVPINQLIIRQ